MQHPAVLSIQPESPKFHASLLFVHGLWSAAADWRPAMGFLAHRGWPCYAIDLSDAEAASKSGPDATLASLADYVAAIAERLAPPPVLIGHDFGASLVLAQPIRTAVAVVAIAPLLPASSRHRSPPVVATWSQRWSVWRRRPVPPPHDTVAWFGEGRLPARHEAPSLVAAVAAAHFVSPAIPAVLVSAEDDAVSSRADLASVAERRGLSLLQIGGGHAVPFTRGREACCTAIHRWLVQRLGSPLLAWRDDEPDGQDDPGD